MKITVKSEEFINADAPVITEEMLDWLFLTLWRPWEMSGLFTKVETIDIMANTAYNGARTIHFYITINGQHNYHREWSIGAPTSCQHPQLGYYFKGEHEPELNISGKPKERWEWMENFIKYGKVDMGPEGKECMSRIDEMWKEYDRLEVIKKEKESKKYRYQQYLELKQEFEQEKY